ncbi:MAG: contractile injection system protein, VgrG/Pvc8 family [Verrucomicrobiota bacterium]
MAEVENTAPESKILINDAEIPPDLKADVLEAVVCQHADGPSSFDVTLNIVGPENLQMKWVDDARVQPGNKLEIRLGYLDKFESLIIGEITALHPKYSTSESARMHVQGFDRLHRLRRGRKTRSFVEVKDSQIAEALASENGLAIEAQDSGVVFDYVLQNNVSDFDFLLERARRIRYEVRADQGRLLFRRVANHLDKVLTLEYAKTLIKFCPRLTTAGQVDEVKVRAWNPASKEAVMGVARAGDEDARMGGKESGAEIARAAFGAHATAVVHVPLATQAEADQVAHAIYNEMALEFVSGEGEAVGNVGIQAGRTIELKGLGKRFGGNYYVKRAEHRVSPKTGYNTKFQVMRAAV